MAVATGGTVFGDDAIELKLEDVAVSNLGRVGEVVVTKDDTLLMNGEREAGRERKEGRQYRRHSKCLSPNLSPSFIMVTVFHSMFSHLVPPCILENVIFAPPSNVFRMQLVR